MLCKATISCETIGRLVANYGCNLGLGERIRSAVLVSPQLICNAEMHVSVSLPHGCQAKMSKEGGNATFPTAWALVGLS